MFSVAEIDAYLAKLEEVLAQQPPEDAQVRAAQLQAAKDLQIVAYRHASESSLEMFRSVIVSGQMALRGAILVNGPFPLSRLRLFG